jgi:hypothetical protein
MTSQLAKTRLRAREVYLTIVLFKKLMRTLVLVILLKVQLPHCSLSCESRMRSGLTLILSHFFAASRASIGPLYSTLRILTAQATMGKLYVFSKIIVL